jgi:hypothetical protein
MPGPCLLDGVNGQETKSVDAKLVKSLIRQRYPLIERPAGFCPGYAPDFIALRRAADDLRR